MKTRSFETGGAPSFPVDAARAATRLARLLVMLAALALTAAGSLAAIAIIATANPERIYLPGGSR